MANDLVGFIIDTPSALIRTKTKDLIIDKSTSGEINFSGDNVTINAGQGLLALAEIPKSTKIEVKITNAEFSLDQLALTSGGDITIGAKEYTKYGDVYTVATLNKITIPNVVIVGSVKINGLTETTGTVATGQFKVTISTSTEIQFFTDIAVGTEIKPSYKILTASTVSGLSVKTTSTPGSGEVILTFPIYASDDVESDIWANGQITLYKAKINQSSKIGGSVKSASTFDISFSTLDPRRADKKAWDFVILPIV